MAQLPYRSAASLVLMIEIVSRIASVTARFFRPPKVGLSF